jgi:hypothetical protein
MPHAVTTLQPSKKRRINRAFNAYIEPRRTDIERVEAERRANRNWRWIIKGSPK